MIILNRIQFILALLLGAIVFSDSNSKAAISSWGNDAIIMLYISSTAYITFLAYARVIDANKDIYFAHAFALSQVIPLLHPILLNVAELFSAIFCITFCFYRESLVAVISYQDENKAIEKLKRLQNFSPKEPLEVLIDTAKQRNKNNVLAYLEGLM